MRTVVPEQLLCVLNTGFHVQPCPRDRVLPGLSVASGSVGRSPSLASPRVLGPPSLPSQWWWRRWPALGYRGNLVMPVPAPPSFPMSLLPLQDVSAAPFKKSPRRAIALGRGHTCMDGGGQERGFYHSARSAMRNCDSRGSLNSETFLSPSSGFWKS